MAIAEAHRAARHVSERNSSRCRALSYDQQGCLGRIAQAEEGLKAAEEQLAKRERDREKLRLVAPQSGTVLPPTLVPKQTRATRSCRPGRARR